MTLRVAAVDLGATERPGDGRRGRVRSASRLKEVHRFPNGGVPGRRLAALGRARHPPRGARRCRRGGAHRASCTGSASTRGRSTTACSTATASCSATRYCHRDSRTDGVPELVRRRSTRAGAVRRHRPAAAAVQHALPARRRPRHRGAGVGRHDAPAARPARLLADRRGRRRAHQRLDDRAATTSAPASGPASWPSRLGLPGRSCRRCATPAPWSGRCCPRSRPTLGLAPDVPVIAVGSHDTASAVVGVPADASTAFGLHLLGHVVARRPRARRAGAHRGGARGRLHQRGRRGRHRSASSRT